MIAIIIVFVGIFNYFTSKNLYNGKIAQNIYIEDVTEIDASTDDLFICFDILLIFLSNLSSSYDTFMLKSCPLNFVLI